MCVSLCGGQWQLQVVLNWQFRLTTTPTDDQIWQSSWEVLVYDQRSSLEQRLINIYELWNCIPVCSWSSRESQCIRREMEAPGEMALLVPCLSFKPVDLSLSCVTSITSIRDDCISMWAWFWPLEPLLTKWGPVACVCDPSIAEADAGGSLKLISHTNEP